MTVSDHEVSQDPDRIQNFKPVNLNPSKSGPTLEKILQGKYSAQNIETKCITVNSPSSIPKNPMKQVKPTETSRNITDQENNLELKIESQENNLKRKKKVWMI